MSFGGNSIYTNGASFYPSQFLGQGLSTNTLPASGDPLISTQKLPINYQTAQASAASILPAVTPASVYCACPTCQTPVVAVPPPPVSYNISGTNFSKTVPMQSVLNTGIQTQNLLTPLPPVPTPQQVFQSKGLTGALGAVTPTQGQPTQILISAVPPTGSSTPNFNVPGFQSVFGAPSPQSTNGFPPGVDPLKFLYPYGNQVNIQNNYNFNAPQTIMPGAFGNGVPSNSGGQGNVAQSQVNLNGLPLGGAAPSGPSQPSSPPPPEDMAPTPMEQPQQPPPPQMPPAPPQEPPKKAMDTGTILDLNRKLNLPDTMLNQPTRIEAATNFLTLLQSDPTLADNPTYKPYVDAFTEKILKDPNGAVRQPGLMALELGLIQHPSDAVVQELVNISQGHGLLDIEPPIAQGILDQLNQQTAGAPMPGQPINTTVIGKDGKPINPPSPGNGAPGSSTPGVPDDMNAYLNELYQNQRPMTPSGEALLNNGLPKGLPKSPGIAPQPITTPGKTIPGGQPSITPQMAKEMDQNAAVWEELSKLSPKEAEQFYQSMMSDLAQSNAPTAQSNNPFTPPAQKPI